MGINAISNLTPTNDFNKEITKEKQLNNFKSKLDEVMKSTDNDEVKDKELKEACQQFESYFINKLLKQMRSTINYSDMVPRSNAEKTFQEMLDEKYSEQASKGKGIGLADMMFKQIKMQDAYKNINNIG